MSLELRQELTQKNSSEESLWSLSAILRRKWCFLFLIYSKQKLIFVPFYFSTLLNPLLFEWVRAGGCLPKSTSYILLFTPFLLLHCNSTQCVDRKSPIPSDLHWKTNMAVTLLFLQWCQWNPETWYTLKQWSPTLGLWVFLDYNSQNPSPPRLLARIFGSWSPRTSGGPLT